MNTILLVDDEYPSIAAIEKLVDWKKAGFDNVLTADSVALAKAQFFKTTIKVLLCDIEMPGETGLDLLQWLRSYSPETVGVFLTCHADFTYAKEAVRMGAFDYLLKPASMEDIEAVTARALAEWERRQNNALRETLWKRNKNAVIERFWWDVFNSLVPDEAVRLAREVERKRLPVDVDASYLLVSCVIRRWNLDMNVWEKYDLDYTVKNVLEEIFEAQAPFLISDTTNRTWLLFQMPEGGGLDTENGTKDIGTIQEGAQKFQKFMKEYFKTKSCFYIGEQCPVRGLAEQYRKLLKLEESNVSYDDKIFFSYIRTAQGNVLNDEIEQEVWQRLLAAQKGDELCIRLKQYIHHMVEHGTMSREILLSLYHDVLQVIYSVLAEHNISAKQLLRDFEEEYKEALSSSQLMEAHLEHMVRTAVDYMQATQNQEGVVGEIKKYIEDHLDEDLSRNTLAELACLNPSYLARLFRNKTGYSLVDYITNRKIERVQKLLATTNLSVSQIAFSVGYTNMPYFSKVFKKVSGCTPVEYRKNTEKYEK